MVEECGIEPSLFTPSSCCQINLKQILKPPFTIYIQIPLASIIVRIYLNNSI